VQGIIKALRKIMPKAARRIYVLHFYKNFASNIPGKYACLFACLFTGKNIPGNIH